MYAKNCTVEDLQAVADSLNFKLDATDESDRKRVRFTIKPQNGAVEYRKLNPHPTRYDTIAADGGVSGWKFRKAHAICFHGHYAFFHALFERCPDASVSSSWFGPVAYTRETLRENAQELGMRPLGPEGNIYHDFQIRETCDCTQHDPNPLNIY